MTLSEELHCHMVDAYDAATMLDRLANIESDASAAQRMRLDAVYWEHEGAAIFWYIEALNRPLHNPVVLERPNL